MPIAFYTETFSLTWGNEPTRHVVSEGRSRDTWGTKRIFQGADIQADDFLAVRYSSSLKLHINRGLWLKLWGYTEWRLNCPSQQHEILRAPKVFCRHCTGSIGQHLCSTLPISPVCSIHHLR